MTATSGIGCPGVCWGRGRIGRKLVGEVRRSGRGGSGWGFGRSSPFTVWEVGVPSFGCDKLHEDGVEGNGGTGTGRDRPGVNREMVPLSRKLSMLFAIFRLYGDGKGPDWSPVAGFH